MVKRLSTVTWPLSFKLSKIDKFDEKSDPTHWLRIYSIVVKVMGANSNVMTNYLPIVLTMECRNLLTSLPCNMVDSWRGPEHPRTLGGRSLVMSD
jgi:hypothetical protein